MGPVGAVAALVGALVGGPLTHATATNISRRQQFNKAAAISRDAFIPERLLLDFHHALEEGETKNAFEIIEPAVQEHTEAMLRFTHYLSWWQKIGFKHAWNQCLHYKVKGEPDTPFPAMYAEKKWEGINTKELAAERIDKLLKFAKPR